MLNEKISINLFRKVISSLSCIKYLTKNEMIKSNSEIYLQEMIVIFSDYREGKLEIDKIHELRITLDTFCNECYEESDIFDYAEELQYGFVELLENLNRGEN